VFQFDASKLMQLILVENDYVVALYET